jgi:hypothetical protein
VPCGATPPATGTPQTTGPTGGSSIGSNPPPAAPGTPTAQAASLPAPPRLLAPSRPIDVRPPHVTIKVTGPRTRGGPVAVNVSCIDEGCRAVVGATVGVPSARSARTRTYSLTSFAGRIAKGATLRGRLRFTATIRVAIKRASRKGQRASVRLKITVADAAGDRAEAAGQGPALSLTA